MAAERVSVSAADRFEFGPFSLNPKDARLWRGQQELRLGGKAFDTLCVLLRHAGELVTKQELLERVWPGRYVVEAVLTTAIREIRQALGDSARQPRYLQTVHGRGYRFIAPLSVDEDRAGPALVGRGEELARLERHWQSVQQGQPAVVLLRAEAGLGKSALAEAFADRCAGPAVAVARGQCLDQHGAGEAYLPLLEAFGRLSRAAEGEPLARSLRRCAPDWLCHLPALGAGESAGHEREPGPTRMLQQLADAIEDFGQTQPLLLLLEDLHWSDSATLEWLQLVARRRSARLLVLGTLRPLPTNDAREEQLRSLLTQPAVSEYRLGHLSRDDVQALLDREPLATDTSAPLAATLQQLSQGHPLYLQAMLAAARKSAAQGPLDAAALSGLATSSVRQFIAAELAALPGPQQALLAAASLVGQVFSCRVAAAAVEQGETSVETQCLSLCDGSVLRPAGTQCWADGSLSACYRFAHDLWREVCAASLSEVNAARLHRRIGLCLEQNHARHAPWHAVELALHFHAGRDAERTVRYSQLAAERALGRSAYAQAQTHLALGLEAVAELEEGAGRAEAELQLLLELGAVQGATQGWASPAVRSTHQRTRLLSRRLGHTGLELRALAGLIGACLVHGELGRAQDLSRDMLALARGPEHVTFRQQALMELGGAASLLGRQAQACEFFEQAWAAYHPSEHELQIRVFGADLGVFTCAWWSHALILAGEQSAAEQRCRASLQQARELQHPLSEVVALAYAAMGAQLAEDPGAAGAFAEQALERCRDQRFPYYAAWAQMLSAWSRCLGGNDETALGLLQAGLEQFEATGGRRSLAYFYALKAEAAWHIGEKGVAREALAVAWRALREGEERWCQPQLQKLSAAFEPRTAPVSG